MAYNSAMLISADMARIQAEASALAAPDAVLPAANGFDNTNSAMSFADRMKEAIHGVDDKEHLASDKMAAVDSGSSDDLIGAMLTSQDASLSFSMLTQVRNKVVGALDELIKLQL